MEDDDWGLEPDGIAAASPFEIADRVLLLGEGTYLAHLAHDSENLPAGWHEAARSVDDDDPTVWRYWQLAAETEAEAIEIGTELERQHRAAFARSFTLTEGDELSADWFQVRRSQTWRATLTPESLADARKRSRLSQRKLAGLMAPILREPEGNVRQRLRRFEAGEIKSLPGSDLEAARQVFRDSFTERLADDAAARPVAVGRF